MGRGAGEKILCDNMERIMDKRTFKICEAVHLGLDYYYMAKNDRRTLTKEDYELAKRILPTLPEGWYRERHEWDASKW